MTRMKFLSVTILLILVIETVSAQQRNNYIEVDSISSIGIKLVKGTRASNAQYVVWKKKGESVKYTPDEITEYGFKDGTEYRSREIEFGGESKKVFLERLEEGRITLYYYIEKGKKTFFLEQDSTFFVELKREGDFRSQIAEMTNDFEWKLNQTQLLKYNRESLAQLISLYNNKRNAPLPFVRYGINVGYNRTSLIIPSDLSDQELYNITFSPYSSFSLGVFGDFPIKMSNFSLNVGINFSQLKYSAHSGNSQSDVDVVLNTSLIDLPVLLRYTLPTSGWRPFVNAGGGGSYHFKSKSKLYKSLIDQNVITLNEVTSTLLLNEYMWGYSFGVGLQRKLNYKKTASAEFRMNQRYGKEKTMNTSQLEFLISLSF